MGLRNLQEKLENKFLSPCTTLNRKSSAPTTEVTLTKEHALTYLKLGCYIGLTGYLWKDKSEDGVRKILQDNVIPLDRQEQINYRSGTVVSGQEPYIEIL